MTDRDMLELIATQVARLTKDVAEIKTNMATKEELAATNQGLAATNRGLADTNRDLAEVKAEVLSIKDIVVRIEIEHGQKLGALLNGYTQNAERLDRVEAKLAEHDRILLEKFS